MNILRDMSHDKLAATLQSIEASMLDSALRENGIHDTEKRGKIIASFLFAQGVMFDQEWFVSEGTQYYPGLYFSTEPHADLEEAVIRLPCADFGTVLHEYAHGVAEIAVNGGEEIERGDE